MSIHRNNPGNEVKGGLVYVDAYDQQRRGHSVDVRQHYRAWPKAGGGVQLAQAGTQPTANTSLRKTELTIREAVEERKRRSLNGKGYLPQAGDDVELARMAFAEAAQQIRMNPELAAWIIWTAINRIGEKGRPMTAAGVTREPRQFAPTEPRNKLWSQSALPHRLDPLNKQALDLAVQTARDILDGKIPDPTGGAMYFITGPESAGGAHERLRTQHGYTLQIFDVAPSQQVWQFYAPPRRRR